MTLQRVAIPSPNYSTRGGAAVRLIVVHTAEGSTSFASLGSYFASSSSGVSSHAGIDDTPNQIGVYVRRADKAWTAANANPVAVQAELCGFAAWTPGEWSAHQTMLDNTAQWIAEEAAAFGIPIVKLTADQAQSGASGVCQHVDLGSWGGGHWDCGTSFPMDEVLAWASGQASPTPPPYRPPAGSTDVPPMNVDYFGPAYDHNAEHPDVAIWQSQMRARGWAIDVDQIYGTESQRICQQFQAEKGLGVDGLVGPQTWQATFALPIT